MKKNSIVKPLFEEEKDQFMILFKTVLQQDFPEYSDKTKKYIIERVFPRDIVLSEAITFGAWQENKLIGLVNAIILEGGIAVYSWLMVDKKYRKQGIGRKLMQYTEAKLRSLGIHTVQLYSAEWNKEYYKKSGFELVGLHKQAWYGSDDYLFIKILQEPKEENFLR